MFNEIKRTERNIRLLNRMFEDFNTNPIRFSRHDIIKYGISSISVKYNKNEIGYFELDTELYQILKHVAICKATCFVYNNIDLLENGSIDDVNSKLSNYISLDCINRFLNFNDKNNNPTSVCITKDKITIKTKEFDDNYFVRDMDNDFESQKKLRLRLNKKGVITNKHAITKYIEYCIFESFKYISNELLNEKNTRFKKNMMDKTIIILNLKRDIDVLNSILYSKADQRTHANDKIKPITLRHFTDFKEISTVIIESDRIQNTFHKVNYGMSMIEIISKFLTYRFIELELKEYHLSCIDDFNKQLSSYINTSLNTSFRNRRSEVIINKENIMIGFQVPDKNEKLYEKRPKCVNIQLFEEKEYVKYIDYCIKDVLLVMFRNASIKIKS